MHHLQKISPALAGMPDVFTEFTEATNASQALMA